MCHMLAKSLNQAFCAKKSYGRAIFTSVSCVSAMIYFAVSCHVHVHHVMCTPHARCGTAIHTVKGPLNTCSTPLPPASPLPRRRFDTYTQSSPGIFKPRRDRVSTCIYFYAPFSRSAPRRLRAHIPLNRASRRSKFQRMANAPTYT